MKQCNIISPEQWTKSSISYLNKKHFLRAKQRQKDGIIEVFHLCVHREWNNAKSSHQSNDLKVQHQIINEAMSIRQLFQLLGITSALTMDTAYSPKLESTGSSGTTHTQKRDFYHLVISQALFITRIIWLYSNDETASPIMWGKVLASLSMQWKPNFFTKTSCFAQQDGVIKV